MIEENVALIKRGYELMGKGDLDTLRDLFTDDALWHTVHGAFEPDYKGIDAVFGYFGELFTRSGGTLKLEPIHIVTDNERALVLQHVSATREGKLLDVTMVLVFEYRGERIYEVTEFATDTSLIETFWS